jgi:hypothetical protein
MSRVIKIQKVGKSTIVEIINNALHSEVHVFNKLTNLSLRNGCISINSDEVRVLIQYDELFDKLASTDIKDYLHKAAAIFLFNQ